MRCSLPFAAGMVNIAAQHHTSRRDDASSPILARHCGALLRGVADDLDALGEFAVAIDQRKAQVLSASAVVHRGRTMIN